MKIWELMAYSRKKIKGRRLELLLVCLLPIGAMLLFRLAEAALYSLLLYFGAVRPAGLFTGENTEQLVIAAVFAVLRWTAAAPLVCAAAAVLADAADEKPKGVSMAGLLVDGTFLRRSIVSFAAGRLICFLLLIPAAVSGKFAFELIADGGESSELFAAVNSAVLSVVFMMMWLAARLSITAVPFLLTAYPEKSAVGIVFMAFRFMRGRKRFPAILAAVYALPVLTVVGIPFVLPELSAGFAAGISIFLKEDEYAASKSMYTAFGRTA